MLQAPEKYLNTILSTVGAEKDLSQVIQYFIIRCNKNLHFIINEREIEISDILLNFCHQLNGSKTFDFKPGQRLALLKNHKLTYTKSALKALLSPYTIRAIHSQIELSPHRTVENLNKYIPISDYKIERAGNLLNRISSFQDLFKAYIQSDFFSNEKLLVIANRNLFLSIPKEYPACFVSVNEEAETEIEYNSPLLPKIAVLKNIGLLDNYQQQEINGEQITFNTCIFYGSSKFENSISIIRNYYNQRKFTKTIFIGEKDVKIDLGNNQIPLRWRWTIPELKFFKGERIIQHKSFVIHNNELEKTIAEFYQAVRTIESNHTVGLRSIYRFIRRLYFDWNLKQETTFVKLHQIQQEFYVALKRLLIETLGNILTDFNFDKYQKPLSAKFGEIIKAVKSNNKIEWVRSYPTKIDQLILPSFLCNANKVELNQIFNQSQNKIRIHSLQDVRKLETLREKNFENNKQPYFSLIAGQTKTQIVPFSTRDDSKDEELKVISSIYGNWKVERLIERLGLAKSEYKLLMYDIEEKVFQYHKDKYHSELNQEYASNDRYEICGVEFNDPYYHYSTFDEWLEDFANTKNEEREIHCYKISFTDGSKIKLPASKSVLKIEGSEKYIVSVEDLSVDNKVLIYANPDKRLLRSIMQLMNPELMKKADELSLLWRTCLKDAYRNNIITEPLYQQLVKNGFSVSEVTFRKYLDGEVMFPRSFSDLIVVAKTINDPYLSLDFLKNTIKPKIEEYRGKEIEYGFKFSNSINYFIISGEEDEFISEWLTTNEIKKIVSQIPVKSVKDIELIEENNDD